MASEMAIERQKRANRAHAAKPIGPVASESRRIGKEARRFFNRSQFLGVFGPLFEKDLIHNKWIASTVHNRPSLQQRTRMDPIYEARPRFPVPASRQVSVCAISNAPPLSNGRQPRYHWAVPIRIQLCPLILAALSASAFAQPAAPAAALTQ